MRHNQAWIYKANRNWFNMSARKIPKNYRNVTGIVSSQKAIGQAGFESSLERDFICLIEFSPEVEDFEVQPIRIEWKDEAEKKRSYVPDVLVNYTKSSNRVPCLFEVKYRKDLAENWKELKPKFRKALAFARGKGWRFKIVTEVEIRTPLLDNARFLLPYTMRGPGDEGYMELLDLELRARRESTPRELIQAIFQDEWNQARLLPTLWYLVGTFQIRCDLAEPLNMNSTLRYVP